MKDGDFVNPRKIAFIMSAFFFLRLRLERILKERADGSVNPARETPGLLRVTRI
jgi:hypothetical protein